MDNINWLPLVTLVAIISFFSIGAGPLTWTMNAELFPQEVTRMSEVAGASCGILIFVVAKFGPTLQ